MTNAQTDEDLDDRIVCTVCNQVAVPNNSYGRIGITEHVKREHPMLFAALKAQAARLIADTNPTGDDR